MSSNSDVTQVDSMAPDAPAAACPTPAEAAPPSPAPAATVWPPLKGTELGDYVLLEEIGRGGMGVVYKARQRQLDRDVAIKLILTGRSATQADQDRFFSEARLAARIRHPNMVGIYEAGQCFGWHYIAMEYVEGTSLADRLQDGPMDAHQAAALLETVARAVDHLHAQGMLHCDLKPGNILIDRSGTPYVADFGLARILGRPAGESGMDDGYVAGTPDYMSPEQAAGNVRETGPASDVYSLGAILYHLLTGQPPLTADSVADTLERVIHQLPSPPRQLRRDVPRALQTICMKCIEKKPARRYDSAAAVADDLARFLCGEPLEAKALNPAQRLVRWAVREPALAGRTIAMAAFYAVEMLWYHLLGISGPTFHRAVTILLPLWAALAFCFQRLEGRTAWRRPVRWAWALSDTVFLTTLLVNSQDLVASPVVYCYPVLVVVSGLWHQVSLVWAVTALSILSYAWLWLLSAPMAPEAFTAYDRHIVFMCTLAITGFLVSRLAYRIQTLSHRVQRRT